MPEEVEVDELMDCCWSLGILNLCIVALKFENVIKVFQELIQHGTDRHSWKSKMGMIEVWLFVSQIGASIMMIMGTEKRSPKNLKHASMTFLILAIVSLFKGMADSMYFGKPSSSVFLGVVEALIFLYCLFASMRRAREIEEFNDLED